MSFTIKELQNDEDWAFFKELDYQSYITTINDVDSYSEEELKQKYKEFDESDGINPRDSSHTIFILWKDDIQRVGLIWVCNREPFWRFKKQHVWIFNLHIIAEYRGKGLAKDLMLKAEDWCLEQGLDTLALHAIDDNTAARTLYESLGYILVETHNESCFYEKHIQK